MDKYFEDTQNSLKISFVIVTLISLILALITLKLIVLPVQTFFINFLSILEIFPLHWAIFYPEKKLKITNLIKSIGNK